MIVAGTPDGERRPCLETTVGRDEPISVRVLEAVSEVSETEALDLPPLASSVDTNALDGMFEAYQTDWRIHFRYHGYEVVVDSDRTVELYEVQ